MQTLSKSEGIGGSIKETPEDFVVKEITGNGTVLEPDRPYTASELGEKEEEDGEFTTFVLQKKNWETIRSLLEIAKRTEHGRKSIGYAGTKDKKSVSVQLASIYGISPEGLKNININDISINGSWKSTGVELGSNVGNSFSVMVKNTENSGNIDKIKEELGGWFPNYFDRQRFGYRLNNHRVGMAILNNDLEKAAMIFLTDTSNETNEESRVARERLADEKDFKGALNYFPKFLKYERTMIDYISRYGNYGNSIRKLPRGIMIMFIHAVEALIFNISLEKRIEEKDYDSELKCGKNFYDFPDIKDFSRSYFSVGALVGYETEDRWIDEYEKVIIEDIGITKDSFKIKSLPELSMKGALRPLLAPFKGFSRSSVNEKMQLNFSIPSGSYATILINEFTKNGNFTLEALP